MRDKAKKEGVKEMSGEPKDIGAQMIEIGRRGAKAKGQSVMREVQPMDRAIIGGISEDDNADNPVVDVAQWAADTLQQHAAPPSEATMTLADGTVASLGDVKIDTVAQQRVQERAARGVTRPVGIRGPRFSGG